MKLSTVLFAAALSVSCFDNPQEPSSINVYQNQNVNLAPNPNPSPSPGNGSGNLPEGSTLRVGIFGPDCPSGVTPPNNGSAQIRVSCRGAGITATPKDRSGNDLDPAVHGPDIAWTFSPNVSCTQFFLSNAFNVFCSCQSAGTTWSISARVKNVTGVLNGSCVS